jgi:hypothetical protein|eukprot:COSAG01_NODE_9029_length_2577_cov_80.088781_2_plen_71_part_00
MFTATIGAYNARTQPVFHPQPRQWKREKEPEAESTTQPAVGPGKRKAGQNTLSGQAKDPTWRLEQEILGR